MNVSVPLNGNNSNPQDFDIPFDWLYRGKSSKSKKPRSNQLSSIEQDKNKLISEINITKNVKSENKNRTRSVSVSNAALQSDNLQKQNADLSSPVSKKERSSSGSSKMRPAVVLPLKTAQVKRSSSMNEKPSNFNNNNNANTTSAPKKSLFGSIFGKKMASSSSSKTPVSKIVTNNASSTMQQSPVLDENVASPVINRPLRSSSTSSSTPLADAIPASQQQQQIYSLKPSSTTTYSSSPASSTASSTLSSVSSKMTPTAQTSSESLASLSKIKLKRVTFSVDKFDGDPPQQLPTRKPKQGNILIPSDMISDVPSISMGITTPSSATSNNPGLAEKTMSKDSREYKIALENYKKLLDETVKHQQEAHIAAKRIAREVQSFNSSTSLGSTPTSPPASAGNNTSAHTVLVNSEIDKPIHLNEHPFQHADDVGNNTEDEDLTLDIIYTRCCHLREILPIPSTLRQVKGKTAPLQVLKFLNPKPTLIDILSFCDFISIVPINTIVFDNVNLSSEMFRILIKSLVNSQVLEKLSLKNVLITKDNWALFGKFLLNNKSLIKLDLSQTHYKFKQTDYITNVVTNPNDIHCLRQNLDWDLFAKIITIRQGKPLEELLLNGVKFNGLPIEKFQNLLNSFTYQTSLQSQKNIVKCRLGLANSELSSDCLKIILNWMSSRNQSNHKNLVIQGVDLAFNDLSQYVKSTVSRLSSLPFDNLEFFTLNSTNISRAYDLALILKYLSKLPNLKFLDLSNLPHLFPDVLPYIYKYLPRFTNLRRLHIDNNNLTYKQLGVTCNILIKCQSLTHISLMQPKITLALQDNITNENVHGTESAISDSAIEDDVEDINLKRAQFAKNGLWAGLYRLVRDSPNLINLDVNFEDAPEEIQSRIALCLMRNMNKSMDSAFQLDELTVQDDLLFDGELITGGAEAIFTKLNKLIAEKEADVELTKEKKAGDNAKKYLLKKYFENLHQVHENVLVKIDSLFEKRNAGELTLKEKENLLRFIMLEKNLSHIFEVFHNSPVLGTIINSLKLKEDMQRKHCASSAAMAATIDTEVTPVSEVVPEARPHLMATDSGRTIDCLTGKPVLFRRSSTTSIQGKVQQEEEGELHKWGFFVQQQNMLYPEGTNSGSSTRSTSTPDLSNTPPVYSIASTPSPSVVTCSPTGETIVMAKPAVATDMKKELLTKIPSGDELRAAIIKARGIDSMHDLIQSVSDEPIALETIYGDSVKVNETYDKLLNNISASRTTK